MVAEILDPGGCCHPRPSHQGSPFPWEIQLLTALIPGALVLLKKARAKAKEVGREHKAALVERNTKGRGNWHAADD